jgi:hypothetical protein
MVSFNPRKAPYIEEIETIWRPHRDALSLLGEGYSGSTLTGYVVPPAGGSRHRTNRSRAYETTSGRDSYDREALPRVRAR